MSLRTIGPLTAIGLLSLSLIACTKTKAPEPTLQSAEQAKAQAITPQEREEKMAKAMELALNTVYFDFDSSALKEEAKPTLAKMAEALKLNPTVKLKIEGHTDERGSNEYNLVLSEKRAKVLKDFLVAEGVPERRLVTSGWGEEKPAQMDAGEQAWAKNRRGEFVRI